MECCCVWRCTSCCGSGVIKGGNLLVWVFCHSARVWPALLKLLSSDFHRLSCAGGKQGGDAQPAGDTGGDRACQRLPYAHRPAERVYLLTHAWLGTTTQVLAHGAPPLVSVPHSVCLLACFTLCIVTSAMLLLDCGRQLLPCAHILDALCTVHLKK